MKSRVRLAAGMLGLLGSVACSAPPAATPTTATSATSTGRPATLGFKLKGPLVPAVTTMVTAWEVPRNPLTDSTLDNSKLSNEIRLGYRIFTNTPGEAPHFAPGRGSCNNCHLNAGQREKALPLVNVASMFPEYNRRAGRLISLNDRIVDCFLRSQNATGRLPNGEGGQEMLPTPASKEVLAISAYLVWIARGSAMGQNPTWRGQNTIPAGALIPMDKLDRARGEEVFNERCTNCHRPDGQGATIGDKRPGPLWGPDSWNDGAGAARVYTLAGIIRHTMPYLAPGSLNDADAQHVAAFINSKPRPSYPLKDRDYLTDPLPVDAVYYAKR